MYLKQTKRNGRVYLSVMQNYREGNRVRSKTVESLGYVDELAKQYEDPIAHFKGYVAALNAERAADSAPVQLTVARNAQIPLDIADAVDFGSAITLAYLDAFDAGTFFGSGELGGMVGAGRVFEFLASARMQQAVPIHQTWSARSKFPRAFGVDYAQVFRAFESIAARDGAYVEHLNRRYVDLRGPRKLDDVRLVLSNYTFRWPTDKRATGPDETLESEWARLCLVIDGAGIPIAYRIVPRDISPGQVLDLIDELKERTEATRVTIVAAQLPEAQTVIEGVLAAGNGFVLLASAQDTAADVTAWANDASDYATTKNGAYRLKSRVVKLSLGKRAMKVKQIAFKTARGADAQAFCIESSEVASSDGMLFNIYRELWRVHEPFQVVSADFISKPYPVDTTAHMRAHFLVCYTAFFALRVLRQDMDWRYNAATVADALSRLEGAYLDENWYLFNYRTEVTDAVEEAAGADVARRIMSRDDIRRQIAQMKRHIAVQGGR